MKSFNLDTTVTVCGGTPQEPVNVSNSNDTYVVDTLVDLELPNINVTDSDGTITSVPSMENVTCTPSTPTSVRVSNSDDSYDVNTLVDLELPNSNISNSDNSYISLVPATSSLDLPDTVFTDSDGTISNVPATNAITATPQVPQASVNISNSNDSYSVNTLVDLELPNISFTNSDGIVTSVPSMENIVSTACPVKSGIAYNRVVQTGATISYRVGDDAWNAVSNPYSNQPTNPINTAELDTFTTLKQNNAFGTLDRFTDINGLQVYADNYVIDNYTGLGWYRIKRPTTSWNGAIDTALIDTQNGLTGWRVSNVNELLSIANRGDNRPITYFPLNIFGTSFNISTSTTRRANSLHAWYFSLSSGLSSVTAKTSATVIIVRNHF